jgi:hypothetical protein
VRICSLGSSHTTHRCRAAHNRRARTTPLPPSEPASSRCPHHFNRYSVYGWTRIGTRHDVAVPLPCNFLAVSPRCQRQRRLPLQLGLPPRTLLQLTFPHLVRAHFSSYFRNLDGICGLGMFSGRTPHGSAALLDMRPQGKPLALPHLRRALLRAHAQVGSWNGHALAHLKRDGIRSVGLSRPRATLVSHIMHSCIHNTITS